MEQKNVLLSAVSVGVGVGLGLASGKTVSRWMSGNSSDEIISQQIEHELFKQIIDGKETNVKFDEFPYYLSQQTWTMLTSASFVHLKHADLSKHTRNLSAASRAILLCGPSELYQQTLCKALAHYFESKLLIIDISEFSLKMQNKYSYPTKESSLKWSISEVALERMSSLFSSFSVSPSKEKRVALSRQSNSTDAKLRSTEESSDSPKHRCNTSAMSGSSISSDFNTVSPVHSGSFSKRAIRWSFDEKLFLQSLFKVLASVSETSSVILYLRDAERLVLQSERFYRLLNRMIQRLPRSVLVLASRKLNNGDGCAQVDEVLTSLFPYNILIKPPEDETQLMSWKEQLEEDMKMLHVQQNINHIAEVLAANDIVCHDLGSFCHADVVDLRDYAEEIVVSAISHHLMKNKEPKYRNGKLVISSKSLSYGLNVFQDGKGGHKESLKENKGDEPTSSKTDIKPDNITIESKTEAEKSGSAGKDSESLHPKPEVPPDNEFEKRIRHEVIPANEIGVTFADIGALDEIKDTLQELVMLPLRRPDLFKGGLLKPCRGILLFGPPGTGKTMLAKAIANEAGASFINVSMSTITSKWFGEDEKNVRALFTLAAKVSPTIIFVDEVDSMLGQRTRVGEHEAMRKIKNEFMMHWDGLLTKPGERILVLAATNRPFDLDEAIIRRFERRILVGLPSVESREIILRTLLSKEKVEDLDYKELAVMTEGYSGSDLKNLCVTAAYRPVRELIQQERSKDKEAKQRDDKGKSSEDSTEKKEENQEDGKEDKDESVIVLRSLNMEDMKQAKNQVAASFATEGSIMSELQQWNDLYGEGGSRKKQQLSYFL
ncbi:hypothetical protein SAY87_017485 [Trapa incisa]|uniref:AAA+ ATPase domain-containing protein n=1 Tax=Trapa incisa TaxID=236973 RepID=A0AAN7KVW6_9MYRT|nr:hypothetical protein SAY87_017485 [Trapa incisa]